LSKIDKIIDDEFSEEAIKELLKNTAQDVQDDREHLLEMAKRSENINKS